MQNLIDSWKNISIKTKKTLTAIVVGTAAIAIFGVMALRMGVGTEFSTLFTGLNQEEAQEVVSLLQEEGVDFRFDDKNGTIRVTESEANQLRAQLLSKGYPQSGFTYDMYRDNTGLMTTESDKEQYTLYELQDRLGAQIRIFDGVMDAKVTIAEAGTPKYALNDDTNVNASASVVVTMKTGQILTPEKAASIKNLIAKAVRGINFTNVAVFDAASMVEVGGGSSGEDGLSTTKDMTALTSLVESNIASNIRRVLEKLYGPGSVAISVKGTLNMERLIQENTQYMTPDKIDENDKTGLLTKEDLTNDSSVVGAPGAGGVAGADANADVPRYTNQNGENEGTVDRYGNSSADREWLYNTVKEQRQVDPGVLENTTVGIVINTEDTSVSMNDLTQLIANSAGIPLEAAGQNITVIRALSAEAEEVISDPPIVVEVEVIPLPLIIALGASIFMSVLLLIMLILSKRKARRVRAIEETSVSFEDETEPEEILSKAKLEAREVVGAEDEEMDRNEEILNLRMQHSLRLKQNIGEFVDQNPHIAAKLLQSWLRGEGENSGPNRSSDRIKQK